MIAHDFGKGGDRFPENFKKQLDLDEDVLVIEPELPKRTIKGYVNMDKGEERFPDKPNKDPFYDEQPLTELNIDVDKALQATKPEVSAPDFKRYIAGEVRDGKPLKQVREEKI